MLFSSASASPLALSSPGSSGRKECQIRLIRDPANNIIAKRVEPAPAGLARFDVNMADLLSLFDKPDR